MVYLFLGVVVDALGVSICKVMRKGRLLSNRYTPFDDIMKGKSEKDSRFRGKHK